MHRVWRGLREGIGVSRCGFDSDSTEVVSRSYARGFRARPCHPDADHAAAVAAPLVEREWRAHVGHGGNCRGRERHFPIRVAIAAAFAVGSEFERVAFRWHSRSGRGQLCLGRERQRRRCRSQAPPLLRDTATVPLVHVQPARNHRGRKRVPMRPLQQESQGREISSLASCAAEGQLSGKQALAASAVGHACLLFF